MKSEWAASSFLYLVPGLTQVERPIRISKQVLVLVLEELRRVCIEAHFRVVRLDVSNLLIPILLVPPIHGKVDLVTTIAEGSHEDPLRAVLLHERRMEDPLEVGALTKNDVAPLLRGFPVDRPVALPGGTSGSAIAPRVVPTPRASNPLPPGCPSLACGAGGSRRTLRTMSIAVIGDTKLLGGPRRFSGAERGFSFHWLHAAICGHDFVEVLNRSVEDSLVVLLADSRSIICLDGGMGGEVLACCSEAREESIPRLVHEEE